MEEILWERASGELGRVSGEQAARALQYPSNAEEGNSEPISLHEALRALEKAEAAVASSKRAVAAALACAPRADGGDGPTANSAPNPAKKRRSSRDGLVISEPDLLPGQMLTKEEAAAFNIDI